MADSALRRRLYVAVLDLMDPALSPEEVREAVEEFIDNTNIQQGRTAADVLAGMPKIPRSLFEKWAGAFADYATETFLPERIERMIDGSESGRMLLLTEYYEFTAEHGIDARNDLHALAKSTGKPAEELVTYIEAISTYHRRGRPHA